MIETQQTEIEGFRFQMNQLGFAQSRSALPRILKVLGPAVGGGLAKLELDPAASKKGLDAIMDVDVGRVLAAVGVAIERFSTDVSDVDLDFFFKLFAPHTLVALPQAPDNFVPLANVAEAIFGGGRVHVFVLWVWWAIRVNYSGFSSAFSKLATAGVGGTGSSPNARPQSSLTS